MANFIELRVVADNAHACGAAAKQMLFLEEWLEVSGIKESKP
jgi:hypothetical protein